MKKLPPLLALAAALLQPPTANADEPAHEDHSDGDWSITAGAGILTRVVSPGIGEYRTQALPYIDLTYRDRYYLSVARGLGATLIQKGGFTFDAAFNYDHGREEKDARTELHGMGDIKESIEVTATATYAFCERFQVGAKFSQSLNDDGYDGFRVELSARTEYSPLSRLTLGLQPYVSFGSADTMKAFYGVTAAQSLASGYRPFTPEGGAELCGARLSAHVRLTDHWSFVAEADGGALLSDAKDSPLTRKNSQLFGGMAFFVYRF